MGDRHCTWPKARRFLRTACLALLGVTLAWGAPQVASALTQVKLKSGVTLEGTVLEELPGGGLRMILLDGSTRDIGAAEIASIQPGWAPPGHLQG